MALWAAKSFYHFSGVDWPVVFHDGGGLDNRIRKKLFQHFPNAEVIGSDEATQRVEPRLLDAEFKNVATARRANVLVRKLVDFAVLSSAPNVLCIDPDVLIVGKPHELIQLCESNPDTLWFNRDSHDMYAIEKAQSLAWFGLELPSKVNSGLVVIPVQSVDLRFIDQAFALDRVPVAKNHFAEQTAFALLASRLGGPAFLPPEKYTVATGTPPLDIQGLGLVSRHYVNPVRYLFYEEGLPFLMRRTNLLARE